MSLYLDKLLTHWILPPGFFVLALIVVAMVAWRVRHWIGVALTLIAAGLWVVSMPIVADALEAFLAQGLEHHAPQNLPVAGAIVVLGGAVRPSSDGMPADLNAGADRIIYAARLYRARRARLVVASGGGLPWLERAESEAEAMRRLLVELGVPRHAILLETHSRNTYENGRAVAALLAPDDIEEILLVTSAWHMPRALAVYRAQGFEVIPAATDFEADPIKHGTVFGWMPEADALERASRFIKEYVGYMIYDWRGWLDEPRARQGRAS